jgi:hypothetical protein
MFTLAEMKKTSGMIVPVWFPESMSLEDMERVLTPALVDVGAYCSQENVLAIVDGAPKTQEAALRVQKRIGGFEIVFKEKNEGKGGVVATGIDRLLKNPSVRFIVVRDHDNDHLVNDALNLVNLSAKMQADTGSDLVTAIGCRTSVHRHLGFVRGEYEWMINEVAFESAKYALARQGKTINSQYYAAYKLVPDMQTGFKCYGRSAAKLIVDALNQASSLTPGLDVRRNGAEIPPIIETLLHGGTIGEVIRSTCETQPLSTYDLAGRVQVKGTVLAWTLRRTDVPTTVARQLLANAIARRLMSKEESGMKDLLTLANWTLEKMAGFRGETVEPIKTLKFAEYF